MLYLLVFTRIIKTFNNMKSSKRIPGYTFISGGSFEIILTHILPKNINNITISVGKLAEIKKIKDINSKDLESTRDDAIEYVNHTYLIDSIIGSAYINGSIEESGRYDIVLIPPIADFSCYIEFNAKNPNSYLDDWMYRILTYNMFEVVNSLFHLVYWIGFAVSHRVTCSAESIFISSMIVSFILYNTSYLIEMKHFNESNEETKWTTVTSFFKIHQFFLYVLFLPLSGSIKIIKEKWRKAWTVFHVTFCLATTICYFISMHVGNRGRDFTSACLVNCFFALLWFFYAIKSDCDKKECIYISCIGIYIFVEHWCVVSIAMGISHWLIKFTQDRFFGLSMIMTFYTFRSRKVNELPELSSADSYSDEATFSYKKGEWTYEFPLSSELVNEKSV